MPVHVIGPKGSRKIFALLDDGSSITAIDASLAYSLGLKGKRVNINIMGIIDSDRTIGERIDFAIEGTEHRFVVQGAIAVSNLSFPTQTLPKVLVRQIAREQSIFLEPYVNVRTSLLIGQDNLNLLLTREFRKLNEQCGVSLTPLGWVAHGCFRENINGKRKSTALKVVNVNACTEEIKTENNTDVIEAMMRQYFDIDGLGIRDINKPSLKHSRALEILVKTSRQTGSGWETGLIWRHDHAPNVDSHATALKRLLSLEKRLDRDENYAKLYRKELERFLERGYAVKVSDEDYRARIWYLPHFGVTSASKPGKVRLVFDAAARTAGFSLNDQLDSGPDLLQNLFGVLIRFRQHAVAVKGDIKDMYLRVWVRPEDRGALRFLWRDSRRRGDPDIYEMTCLVFGANSSPCSAIYIKDANARSFAAEMPDAASSIVKNSYVDDYLASRPTCKEANDLVRDVIKINAQARFEMHGWASNRSEALAGVSESNQLSENNTPLCDRVDERVLGLHWDVASDMLGFNVGLRRLNKNLLNGERKPTKREFLQSIMSVYDPLGLLSPFVVKSKIIMQNVWRTKIGWDDELHDDEYEGWRAWLESIKILVNLRIPRCLSPAIDYSNVQLHAFCDASLLAYAAAVYLRFSLPDGTAHVVLVMAKSRVAPVRQLSVPRLELQSALIASRLLKSVQDELEIQCNERFLWSDSQTVLRWIKSEPRLYQIYVAHCLGEISELTAPNEWRYVPSKLNPADCATRGQCDDENVKDAWFNGPKYLRLDKSFWPKQKALSEQELSTIDTLETRRGQIAHLKMSEIHLPFLGRLFGWEGIILAAMRVIRYVNRWCKRSEISDDFDVKNLAEKFVFRQAQEESFPDEMTFLRQCKDVKKNSKIITVSPFLDSEGIMRARGRVTRVKAVYFNNTPIILDGKHPCVRQLIARYHRKYLHANRETVINELRQLYYIVGLRTVLKSIMAKCLLCKIKRAKPFSPEMAPLPECRTAYRERPFSHCGMDCFGPLFVKVRRSREKRWGLLFTCMSIRAIHLELVNNLSTNSVIMALQRLAARRGVPQHLYSDNGTNFRGACSELKENDLNFDSKKLHEYTLRNGIRWHFNPPDAPHAGGAWERLIKSVKIALNAILKDEATNEEILQTAFTEVEHMVNSRPLTNVTIDPHEGEALTPNHFLIGASSGNIRLGSYTLGTINVRQQWQLACALSDEFWKRWLREYLPTLLPRKKWHESDEPIKVDDFVLIIDLQAPRNSWRKGKVVEVFPGSDGIVRTVKVRTPYGDFVRSVRKLVKIFHDDVQN